MIFKARIEEGKLKVQGREYMAKVLADLEGKDVTLTIEEYSKEKRTTYQNKWYWSVVRQVSNALNDIGYRMTEAETHAYLGSMFLTKVIDNPIQKGNIVIIRSTTSLGVKEFSQYMEDILRFSAENLDLVIEHPSDWLMKKYI